jgi:hypothetical protein
MRQVWIAPGTGLATAFLEQLEAITSDSTGLMMVIFAVFAVIHSGLAFLRPYGASHLLLLGQGSHASQHTWMHTVCLVGG